MKSREKIYPVSLMCECLQVQRSGYYAWLTNPESKRAREDKRLLGLIKQSWHESGCAYGYRNINRDLKSQGETCGKNRIHRIMKVFGICSQRG